MNKKKVAVVLSAAKDLDFALANVLIGLRKNTGKVFWDDIIVYHDGIEEREQELISGILPCKFLFYTGEKISEKAQNAKCFQEYSLSVLSGFECLHLLQMYKKVIRLDLDTLIRKDISGLLAYGEKTGLACTHIESVFLENSFEQMIPGFDMLKPEYNTGLMVLSDKLLDYGNIYEYCYDAFNQYYDDIRYPDQAVLNLMLQKFGITPELLDITGYGSYPSFENEKDASIIHVFGNEKFWNSARFAEMFPEWTENNRIWSDLYTNEFPEDPKISVIMSVYDRIEFLDEAVNSILNQTFCSFEFIIVVEFSENQKKIIETIKTSYKDKRIKIIANERKLGFAESLNRGISSAKGKYIARMDDDDISLPVRFRKEYDYLEKNKEISVVGSRICFFGNSEGMRDIPVTEKEIKVFSLFENPLYHPTVLIRKSVFEKGFLYDPHYFTEDYELWTRMISSSIKISNISEVLLQYRISGTNCSWVHQIEVEDSHISIIRRSLSDNLGLDLSCDETRILRKYDEHIYHAAYWKTRRDEVIMKVLQANKDKNFYDQELLERYCKSGDEKKREQTQEEIIASIYASNSYRIGNMIMKPFHKIKQWLKKREP